MIRPFVRSRYVGIVVAAAACLFAAACMLSPGKFTAHLDVRKDGRYSFEYAGEIHVLALSQLAQRQMSPDQPFEPAACYSKESGQQRECTREETAQQKREWEDQQQAGAAQRKSQAEQMKAVFGEIDFTSPRAAEEFAARLRKQAGWRKVEHTGDGRFVVDFAISGRLDHDFTFPTVERFPQFSPFVLVSVRNDGTIRMDAPAFAPSKDGMPLASMSGMMAARSQGNVARGPDGVPMPDGRFTLTTDSEVLSNNTENGTSESTVGRSLEWIVNARTNAAPMAVLRLR